MTFFILRKILKIAGLLLAIGAIALTGFMFLRTPTNDRDWNPDQKVLAESVFDGDKVHIKNIRNNKYRTVDDFDVRYYDKTFDLNKIAKVYYVVEPFSPIAGPAHTFLTFEFTDGNYLSISIEIRKRRGEVFNELLSAINYYELMYVIADENDVVKLRSNYRHDMVFMYPMKAEIEDVRALFVNMLKRANKLAKEPEFYNLFYNTCTTNIVDHVNELRVKAPKIPYGLSIWLPAYSDALAFGLGLIDTDLTIEQARIRYFINQRAEKYGDNPNFSKLIRDTSK